MSSVIRTTHTTTTTRRLGPSVDPTSGSTQFLFRSPSGRHVAAWRTRLWCRQAAARTPAALVVETRAADRAYGSGRGTPPLFRDHTFDARHEGGGGCQVRRLTRPEDSHQSRRGGSPRGAPSPTGTDATSPGDAASTSRRGGAAGACGAALRGAYGRACTVGANSGCSCAAVGGTVGGHLQHLQAH